MKHANISDIPTYLRVNAEELGNRILESYPPLHAIDDPPSPLISKLIRKPYASNLMHENRETSGMPAAIRHGARS